MKLVKTVLPSGSTSLVETQIPGMIGPDFELPLSWVRGGTKPVFRNGYMRSSLPQSFPAGSNLTVLAIRRFVVSIAFLEISPNTNILLTIQSYYMVSIAFFALSLSTNMLPTLQSYQNLVREQQRK